MLLQGRLGALLHKASLALASLGVSPNLFLSRSSTPWRVGLRPHSLASSFRLSLRCIRVLASSHLLASATSLNWSRKYSTPPVPLYFGALKASAVAWSRPPILSRALASLACTSNLACSPAGCCCWAPGCPGPMGPDRVPLHCPKLEERRPAALLPHLRPERLPVPLYSPYCLVSIECLVWSTIPLLPPKCCAQTVYSTLVRLGYSFM